MFSGWLVICTVDKSHSTSLLTLVWNPSLSVKCQTNVCQELHLVYRTQPRLWCQKFNEKLTSCCFHACVAKILPAIPKEPHRWNDTMEKIAWLNKLSGEIGQRSGLNSWCVAYHHNLVHIWDVLLMSSHDESVMCYAVWIARQQSKSYSVMTDVWSGLRFMTVSVLYTTCVKVCLQFSLGNNANTRTAAATADSAALYNNGSDLYAEIGTGIAVFSYVFHSLYTWNELVVFGFIFIGWISVL